MITLFLLLIVGLLPAAHAATCYVSPTGNANINDCTNAADPCRDFKFAIESAVPNCTDIFAAAGLYTGPNNTDVEGSLPLAITAVGGTATVDVDGNGRFLQISGDSADITNYTFVMRNMEIRDGFATSFGGGGVALNLQGTDPSLEPQRLPSLKMCDFSTIV